jgi:hypothetical protein
MKPGDIAFAVLSRSSDVDYKAIYRVELVKKSVKMFPYAPRWRVKYTELIWCGPKFLASDPIGSEVNLNTKQVHGTLSEAVDYIRAELSMYESDLDGHLEELERSVQRLKQDLAQNTKYTQEIKDKNKIIRSVLANLGDRNGN